MNTPYTANLLYISIISGMSIFCPRSSPLMYSFCPSSHLYFLHYTTQAVVAADLNHGAEKPSARDAR